MQFKIHNLVFFLPLLFVQISFCACTLSLFYAFVAVKIHLNIGLTTLKALYIQNWNFTHKVKKDQQSTSTQWEPIVVMSPFCMRPEDLTVQDVWKQTLTEWLVSTVTLLLACFFRTWFFFFYLKLDFRAWVLKILWKTLFESTATAGFYSINNGWKLFRLWNSRTIMWTRSDLQWL